MCKSDAGINHRGWLFINKREVQLEQVIHNNIIPRLRLSHVLASCVSTCVGISGIYCK